jgi:predicted nuclease with RNAse H fold
MYWLGVDVGGPRKGFDSALVDDRGVVALRSRLSCDDVVALVAAARPSVVGIDSPRVCARDGELSRACERRIAREVCGIRFTPDRARVHANGFYGWIVHGLELYTALAPLGIEAIEVFPTASWTRWHGPRGGRARSSWSREALAAFRLTGVPHRTNQDQRDAIAAALTARQYSAGSTEPFGEIHIPDGP